MNKLIISFLVFSCLIFQSKSIFAYSCFGTPPPDCKLYWLVDAVFVGEVTKVESESEFNLKIIKAYRGVDTESVVLRRTPTNCTSDLKIGEKYVIYANNESEGIFKEVIETTGSYNEQSESLKFLESLNDGSPEFNIVIFSDWLFRLNHSIPDNFRAEVWRDKQKIETINDSLGRFKIPVAAAGEYKVRVSLPRDKNFGSIGKYSPETFLRRGTLRNRRYVEHIVQVRPDECGYIDLHMIDGKDQ